MKQKPRRRMTERKLWIARRRALEKSGWKIPADVERALNALINAVKNLSTEEQTLIFQEVQQRFYSIDDDSAG
jgi:hypothetical protein